MTVYNLRSEPINFRVQCDAPTMFKIKPPRGLLPPQTLLELCGLLYFFCHLPYRPLE